LVAGKASSLLWMLPAELEATATARWIGELGTLHHSKPGTRAAWSERIGDWSERARVKMEDTATALETVAVAHALPSLAASLSADLWWRTLEQLVEIAGQSAGAASKVRVEMDHPLVTQWLGGELSLVLAHGFPELEPCRALRRGGRRTLSAGCTELLDGEGVLAGRWFSHWGPLFACWTRCRAIGARSKQNCWSSAAETQYQWMITQTLRIIRRDGSLLLSDGSAGARCYPMLATALAHSVDPADRAAAQSVLPHRKKKDDDRRASNRDDLPEPAMNSAWAGLAVLRGDWSRSGDRLAVRYDGPVVRMELDCGRDVVFRGAWKTCVTVAGEQRVPRGAWEEVCWESDDEADYLELEIELDSGGRIQRQILLARQDRFLYLADTVLGGADVDLTYRASLPIGPAIRFQAEKENWEGLLVGSKPRGLVMPLALPEWRIAASHGALEASDTHLQWNCQSAHGNLVFPLFIDLKPRRMTRQRTWRQLTVAQARQIQPAHVAVGYRVECHRDQWLIYRSVEPPANRTVLGQNLSSDSLVARFTRNGAIEEIVEVEPVDDV